MTLPEPSEAQLKTIKHIKDGHNLVLDCCAGSGKTTTNMYIAKSCKDKNILVLTYNKKLKFETREKVQNLGLNNVEVHSYHSFCVRYYDRSCFTDSIIDKIIKNKTNKLLEFNYNLVIIDEAQDMTPTYFELVCKLVSDMDAIPQICVLGDRNQSIYSFNHADERYITYAKDIFNFDDREWRSVQLNISYRITKNMAQFLNKCAFRYDRMKAVKEGPDVKYIIYNHRKRIASSLPYKETMSILKDYNYEDIFILAPSVRTPNSPIRKLANKLSEEGYPIYVPSDNDKELDNEVIKGKIVFSTYHQTKGLERKVVIVYGCDDSYFKYFKKKADVNKCPNEMYVAWTRAQERLIIMHSASNDYLPFIDKSLLNTYASVSGEGASFIRKDDCSSGSSLNNTPVTDLTRHVPSRVIDKVMEYIDYKQIKEKGKMIKIPIKSKQKDLVEGVSDITGTAIPAYCEYLVKGEMTILEDIRDSINPRHKDILNIDNLTPDKLLTITNYYQSIVTGYVHRINQIKQYDWLTPENLDKCADRVQDMITSDTEFEARVMLNVQSRQIVGYIDAIEDNIIYEFKCVRKLTDDHFIQLAIYAYMYEKMLVDGMTNGDIIEYNDKEYIITTIYKNGDIDIVDKDGNKETINNISISGNRYILYNILTEETWEILPNLNKLGRMIEYLVDEKYSNKGKTSDSNFCKKANRIRRKYVTEKIEN